MNNSLDKIRDRMNELSEFRIPKYKEKILNEQESMEMFHPELMDMSKENEPSIDNPSENQDFRFRMARIGENKVRIQDSETGDKLDIPNDLISTFCDKLTSFQEK